jgi:NAD+ diphosphatase
MMLRLPQAYPNCEQLPFNRAALEADFCLRTPFDEEPGAAYWLMLQGIRVLVTGDPPALPLGDCPLAPQGLGPGVYIGQWQQRPCRLLAVPRETPLPTGLRAQNMLDAEPGMSLALLSLGGVGNAILHWEKTSRFCDNCAAPMQRIAGEWGKKCTRCAASHYPRIHPCIIVLVRRDDELLLVRKPEWVAGRFGLVAGFVEFGENLEQTVAREVLEETGISITNIHYRGSQSWPFPSQLMTGFCADYAGGDICLQADELAQGGWFKRDQLPQLPPRRSIARWLIDQELTRRFKD